MIDEGYIKFKCKWDNAPLVPGTVSHDLIECRIEMYKRGFIGEYSELGIGYGNVSHRGNIPLEFVISGTQTGHLVALESQHFSLVRNYDIEKNQVHCTGLVKASSESLTHAAVYDGNDQVNFVIHIHNMKLWQSLMNQVDTTNKNTPYGTPKMANEVRAMVKSNPKNSGIIVMAGHEEGIIGYGRNRKEAEDAILKHA